jgi:Asp-tRNA(Asn)/Glu-tRNA(Gln) amidotransferase A subunit family amidase
MINLTSQSLATLCRLIQTRAVSPVEVVEAHLQQIEQLNPALNAIVTLAPDALKKAREAQVAIARGEVWGPLHGVPVTIKDTIETAGLRTTSGSRIRADFVPDVDAAAVARLKAAGAIVLGKTNAAEMAMDYTADNPVFGRTNHPQDASLTPGGSSGGEAAAIASFMSPGGIGSDLAGSIRVPAHFCGIAGLRPTVGRVPGAGQFPAASGPYTLGSVIGPMARTVEDLQLLFRVLAAETLVQEKMSLTALSVAWYTDDSIAPVSSETAEAVQNAAEALSRAGLKTKQTRPPGVERGHELWLRLFSRTSVVKLRSVYAGREQEGGDFVRWRLATADDTAAASLDEYIQAWFERDELREALLRWMQDTPLILGPVGATAAVPHGTLKVQSGGKLISTFRAFSYAQGFTVFDLPAVVVTAGRTKEGLPIGVQVAGRPFQEETVLAAAQIIEESFQN